MNHGVDEHQLLGLVIAAIQSGTGYTCYDYVPAAQQSNYYDVAVVSHKENDRVTHMLVDDITITIHIHAQDGSTKLNEMSALLAEAMAQPLPLPDCLLLLEQRQYGGQRIQNADGTFAATAHYKLKIGYGENTKN